jgi:Fe-S-cluster containining protein
VRKSVESKIGLLYQDPECDKYRFEHETEVDCQNRRHLCKVCCKFPSALSRQDVEEGVIRWEFGRPYLIAHGADGYCVHLDRESYRCTVWEQRPVPCLGFDSEDNEKWKVWADCGEKIVNDGLMECIDKDYRIVYIGSKLK